MTTFALIAEGITDQVFLEHLLVVYYEKVCDEEVDVNILQPARDTTDANRQADMGGWEQVLEFCTFSERIKEALALNDYIVIQIDTDCGPDPKFGVSLTAQGTAEDRTESDIIADVRQVLRSKLSGVLTAENEERFIFAISVHSLECWLLFWHGRGTIQRTKSCAVHLREALKLQGFHWEKTAKVYRQLAKPIKGKKLVEMKGADHSLGVFLASLPQIWGEKLQDG